MRCIKAPRQLNFKPYNMEKPEIILENLTHFCGSESLYRHRIGGKSLLYTEGILCLIESCESYWLLDLILSYQDSQILRSEYFQVWNLVKYENKWIVSCSDGDNNLLLDQDIDYSDFPLNSVKFWLVSGTVLLPTEY